ncbi:hypothetical protein AERO9AM_70409 [Aeromicrobium sp. 9AM]|nr:hypothetical protein AERO9AM_70409 [Aeromicrobium sp. 9AM]
MVDAVHASVRMPLGAMSPGVALQDREGVVGMGDTGIGLEEDCLVEAEPRPSAARLAGCEPLVRGAGRVHRGGERLQQLTGAVVDTAGAPEHLDIVVPLQLVPVGSRRHREAYVERVGIREAHDARRAVGAAASVLHVVLFEDCHRVPPPGQLAGGARPHRAAADHDHARRGHRPILPPTSLTVKPDRK